MSDMFFLNCTVLTSQLASWSLVIQIKNLMTLSVERILVLNLQGMNLRGDILVSSYLQ